MSDDVQLTQKDGSEAEAPGPSGAKWIGLLLLLAVVFLAVIGTCVWRLSNDSENWSRLDHWWLIPLIVIAGGYGFLLSVFNNRLRERIDRRRQRRPRGR